MKQVALITVIYVSVPDEGLPGISDLTKVMGLTRSGVIETIEPLVRHGLLIGTMEKNSMGRGTARYFTVASSAKATPATMLGAPNGVELEQKC